MCGEQCGWKGENAKVPRLRITMKRAKERKKIFQQKIDSNHRVLSVKVIRVHLSPARERSDHHQVLRLRTTFLARYPGRGEATR